jgi:hypothetical protein
MKIKLSVVMLKVFLLAGILLQSACSDTQGESSADVFQYDQAALSGAKPWTSAEFQNNPQAFQFVVIGDRTGGANQEQTFLLAIGQLNLLQPEFVINVGDTIEATAMTRPS